jgi:thymidylate synthase (FAD)
MKVKLIRHTCEPEMLAGYAAAKCYKGKDPRKSLEVAMEGGHESVLEHTVWTFEVDEVSRVLLAQITRHRLASFSVQSQRYTGADMNMVVPESMVVADLVDDIVEARRAVDRLYKHARALGVPHEDCRYFTLQGSHTGFVMTMNTRELRHFFSLRMCARAQWEIRELACEMWKQCKEVAPFMFADAGPGCVRGNCPEGAKSCGHPWKVVSRAKA